ncbi:DnaJ domain-containing protein [Oscillatoria sp. FACHB-1406]|uniref:WD40 domain-containing protein n=1 Tax=Oscillatoria sp. FACHB-1406 TaxID=2692846 RepID=UPI0016894F77|nr:DnaJ domain-containing protein [Oscillatoria sp. FACHB-1406]MBD2578968.1 DnaJ domain-containing protein [Oscillatoria sp. FACHB-1406]
MNAIDECYKTLGLHPGVSLQEVKVAYRQLVKRWHPDNFPHDDSQRRTAEETLKRINRAYDILTEDWADVTPPVAKKKVSPEPYYHRGVARAKSGYYKQAIDELTKAILIDSDYIDAYLYRGFLYEKIGQRIRAEKDFNKATKLKLERTGTAGETPSSTARAASPPPVSTEPSTSPWQCAGTFEKHSHTVSTISMSPDGKFFVTGSYDQTLVLWQLSTGRVLKTLKGHFDRIYCVAVSSDSKLIASSSGDKNVKLWKVSSGAEIRTCGGWFGGHSERVLAVAFSPSKKKLISGSGDCTVKIWQTRTGREIRTVKGYASAVVAIAVSPDGKVFASASLEKFLRIREMDGRLLRSLRADSEVWAIAFSPNNKAIAVGRADGCITLWNWHNGEELKTLSGHRDRVSSIAFSPDGKTLASGSWDGQIRLWDWESGTVAAVLSGHGGRVCAVAFSPDGKTLVSGGGDRTVKIWWRQ